MTARVLVVDDILANVKLLEARLTAEYFEVLSAHSGAEALDILSRERVDVVLLDVMMPVMDGFEVCRRIKSAPETAHLPVIMVTALDQPADKVQGLQAGADDFLTKPVDDTALVTRVKNLSRVKILTDEMQIRVMNAAQMSQGAQALLNRAMRGDGGRVLLVDDHVRSASQILDVLAKTHDAFVERDPVAAVAKLAKHNFDLVMVSLSLTRADGLRLCSQIRSLEQTRHLPIIVLVEPADGARLLRALDMGVNDYLMRPIDRNEMLARVKTQVKRKRHSDYLRVRIEESVEAAMIDALTGLHNRRFMETNLAKLVDLSVQSGRPLSVLVADIDHFKRINDTYGHDAGDTVLREFSVRLKRNIRAIDVACRFGGEEFVVIMPETQMASAKHVAERLRACIEAEPFPIDSQTRIPVTASVGVAMLERDSDTPQSVFKRADTALYSAKRNGRNQVVADAA
jgi:two-component system cell cycle response regulator